MNSVGVSELKKIITAAGAGAYIVKAVVNKQSVFTSILTKLPQLLPLGEIQVDGVLPELSDLTKDECVELVGAFFEGIN